MTHPALLAQNAQFRKEVIALAPGMWTAVGFAASNVHMIEGDETVTIVDTTESTGAAEIIQAEFRRITDKPVGRIVYTHSHSDHVSGASVFSPGGVPVIAGHLFASDLVGLEASRVAPDLALARRTQAQFGAALTGRERISLGLGPGDRPTEGLGAGFLAPTELIGEDRNLDLDGVMARLIMAPGETADHIALWFPDSRVLIAGDNWYHAFPNLYAIRGTPYRDFAVWSATLTRLADLVPEVLAPGHTRPVFGAEAVQEVLTTTRDAIDHVIRWTADAMDAGLAMDDIAAGISLPPDLADKPWLAEVCGRLDWSARAYAAGTLGWYDGNPTHLGKMSTAARAAHVAALAGGVEALWAAASEAHDLQWRLELCDHLIALGEEAQRLKAATLEALAKDEINAPARNTYYWEARRLREEAAE